MMQAPLASSVSFASLLLVSLLGAQPRTYVVDAAGGTGTNFLNLESAVAAAAHGDLFLVRPGNYQAPTTTIAKGITIQATGAQARLIGHLKIANVPANRSLIVKDFELRDFLVSATSCAGPLLFDELMFSEPGSAYAQLTGCANVILRHCKLTTVTSKGSNLQIEGGTFGAAATSGGSGIATLQSNGGVLFVADALVVGGTVSLMPFGFLPTAAVQVSSCQVQVRGGQAVLIVQSGRFGTSATASPVVVGDGASRLTLDNAVTLTQPVVSAPLTQGFGSVLRKNLPTLRSTFRPVGGQSWSYTLQSQPGDPFAVAVGLPAAPMALLGGYLHLAPGPLLVLNTGQQPANGVSHFALKLASNPSYRGVMLTLQAIAGQPADLSNGIALSVR